jgi:hypothetical protein
MDSWNDGSLDGIFAFSMGGDFVGNDCKLQIFWQTHEPGSDNTVRISGANLNYTLIEATHSHTGPIVTARRPSRAVPHLVLPGYSRFGPDSGILGWTRPAGDMALVAVVQALGVADTVTYSATQVQWLAQTDAWAAAKQAAKVADPT